MIPYYEKDGCTIYLGDCREILPTLPPVDLVLTDPPYFGREDLFSTEAVAGAMRILPTPALIFWPCLAPYPLGVPDAVHIWHKAVPIHPNSETGNVAGHHYERILSYGAGRRCKVFRCAAIMPNFAACLGELTEHPTQKPLTLVKTLLAKEGGTVLDPFMGSGTTLVAARDLGRKCIGIEIEEKYCEIAKRRLAQGVLF